MANFFDYEEGVESSQRVENKSNLIFLSKWEQEDWNSFYKYTENLVFEKDDLVIKKGEKTRSLMIIVNGCLDVVFKASGKKAKVIAKLEKGEIVGDQAFVDALPRSLDVCAEKQSEIIQVTWDNFKKFAAKEPYRAHYFLMEIARVMSSRLRHMTSLL